MISSDFVISVRHLSKRYGDFRPVLSLDGIYSNRLANFVFLRSMKYKIIWRLYVHSLIDR
jgi:hypothetical protein